MGVIVRPAGIAQPAFRHQVPRDLAARPNDPFRRITPEIVWIARHVKADAVNGYLLADIPRNNTRIITRLFQVVILSLRRTIRQIKRLAEIGIDHLFIRIQREKVLMKIPDMVPRFDRDIIPPVPGNGFEHLAAGEYIDPLRGPLAGTVSQPTDETTEAQRSEHEYCRKQPDMLESAFDIFCLRKHPI